LLSTYLIAPSANINKMKKAKELHTMKSIRTKIFLFFILAITCLNTASAQVAARQDMLVRPNINFDAFDMIYLNDFLDPKTQMFNVNASGISLDLNVTKDTTALSLYLEIQVIVRLRGDVRSNNLLVYGRSSNFLIKGNRTFTARDFVKGGTLNRLGTLRETTDLKKRIIDLAQATSTFPAGTYIIHVVVWDQKETKLGTATKTIVVPYSDVKGVFVEINDPKNGSFSDNIIPTFTWTTAAPSVTLRVFEAGISNRSPQDALTGNRPCLIREVSGVTTLTYPQDAKRLLQENKAYVLQIQANVLTNRGESGNFSRPVVFRITDDKIGAIVENFLNARSGEASSAFSALRAEPNNWVAWPDYGNITYDDNILTGTDLQNLLNEINSNPDLKLQFSIENQ
jgi:hypothetical protein